MKGRVVAEPEDDSITNTEQKTEIDDSNGINKAKTRLTSRRLSPISLADEEEPAEEDAAEWMMTYMDTVTLLVTLFVLLYTVHTDDEKYRKVASSLSIVLGGRGVLEETVPTVVESIKFEPSAEKPNFDEENALDEIKKQINEQGIPDLVDVRVIENLINLEINESVLFDTGQASLTEDGHSLLGKLKTVLDRGDYEISVEGHTDDVPIATERFPSNWELSTGRASTVVRFLIESGIVAERLEAIGHADTRPIDNNETSEGRARNRRVSLILKIGENEK